MTPTHTSSPGKELQWGKPPLQVLPEALGEASPLLGPQHPRGGHLSGPLEP